jgi:hypothetical protein
MLQNVLDIAVCCFYNWVGFKSLFCLNTLSFSNVRTMPHVFLKGHFERAVVPSSTWE